jgi:alpha/beta superfamily hydrolase
MARRIESLFLRGEAGRIEALLEEPEEGTPVEAAIVCHPHPQFGGTMHNKVVYRLARGLRRTGCVVLRFNYRGVNLSEGEYAEEIGGTEDARVSLRELQSRYPALPVLAAGFSFGSRVALRLASEEPAVRRALAAGFPTRVAERDFVYRVTVPKYFIQSTHDQFGPKTDLESFYLSLPQPKELHWVAAGDHFFVDALDMFEQVVEQITTQRDVPYDWRS